jgi:hypothetical protein
LKPVRLLAGALAVATVSGTFFFMTPADATQNAGPIAPTDPAGRQPWAPERTPPVRAAARAMSDTLPGAVEIVRNGITLLHKRTAVAKTPVTGKGATLSDFDGDGRDDVAAFSGGGVVVTYSSAPARDLLITEIPGGSGCVCFGTEMVTGNFNGDKYDDLAVGDPYEHDLSGMGYEAGGVWVFAGSSSGLAVSAVKHFSQATSGIAGTSATGDRFAGTLAAGDVTGDGRDELLVGLPGKKVGGKQEAGAVVVLKGSSGGLLASGSKWIDQNTSGVPGGAETGDHFGSGIAVGKINKDKYRDVVIGAPQEDNGQAYTGSGSVHQFWGASGGVSLSKVTAVYGKSTFTVAEPKDAVAWYIGAELAVADTTGDGYGEVVVGASGAQANWNINGGVVLSLAGRSTGLSLKGMILLSQRDSTIEGASENDDRFGDSIAAGDVTGDGLADVLVGVPGEDIGTIRDAGSVVLLRGSKKGLTGTKSQTITQSSAGVPDGPERDDYFGAAVSILNLNGAYGLDATIGAPGEEVSGDDRGYASTAAARDSASDRPSTAARSACPVSTTDTWHTSEEHSDEPPAACRSSDRRGQSADHRYGADQHPGSRSVHRRRVGRRSDQGAVQGRLRQGQQGGGDPVGTHLHDRRRGHGQGRQGLQGRQGRQDQGQVHDQEEDHQAERLAR